MKIPTNFFSFLDSGVFHWISIACFLLCVIDGVITGSAFQTFAAQLWVWSSLGLGLLSLSSPPSEKELTEMAEERSGSPLPFMIELAVDIVAILIMAFGGWPVCATAYALYLLMVITRIEI